MLIYAILFALAGGALNATAVARESITIVILGGLCWYVAGVLIGKGM